MAAAQRKIESIEEEPPVDDPATPKAVPTVPLPATPTSATAAATGHTSLTRSLSNRSRKTSIVTVPSTPHYHQQHQQQLQQHPRPRCGSADSDVSVSSDVSYLPSANLWNTSVIDNNTIVAQYGSSPYDSVWWDPSFRIDFRLSSSVGLLSGAVTGIDTSKPEVTLKVFNNTAKQIGFSIRSHRQSTAYSSHVVYPNRGLHILEPYKTWEDNVEFFPPASASAAEMFVIDLFFCTMDGKPTWNVVRKYAIMKTHRKRCVLCVCV